MMIMLMELIVDLIYLVTILNVKIPKPITFIFDNSIDERCYARMLNLRPRSKGAMQHVWITLEWIEHAFINYVRCLEMLVSWKETGIQVWKKSLLYFSLHFPMIQKTEEHNYTFEKVERQYQDAFTQFYGLSLNVIISYLKNLSQLQKIVKMRGGNGLRYVKIKIKISLLVLYKGNR